MDPFVPGISPNVASKTIQITIALHAKKPWAQKMQLVSVRYALLLGTIQDIILDYATLH